MRAIFKREMRTFFTNPIGYMVMAVMFGISGWFFYNNNLSGSEYGLGDPDLSHLFMNLFEIVLLAMPFLTMRLLSEEKQRKTDQALLTAPVTLEVNFGGIAKGHTKSPYPAAGFLARWLRAGKPVQFSSDCHKAENLLFGYDFYENYVENAGKTP